MSSSSSLSFRDSLSSCSLLYTKCTYFSLPFFFSSNRRKNPNSSLEKTVQTKEGRRRSFNSLVSYLPALRFEWLVSYVIPSPGSEGSQLRLEPLSPLHLRGYHELSFSSPSLSLMKERKRERKEEEHKRKSLSSYSFRRSLCSLVLSRGMTKEIIIIRRWWRRKRKQMQRKPGMEKKQSNARKGKKPEASSRLKNIQQYIKMQ